MSSYDATDTNIGSYFLEKVQKIQTIFTILFGLPVTELGSIKGFHTFQV